MVTMKNPSNFHNYEIMSEIMAMEKSLIGDAFDLDQSNKKFYCKRKSCQFNQLDFGDHELQLPADYVTSIFSNSITCTITKGKNKHDEHDFVS